MAVRKKTVYRGRAVNFCVDTVRLPNRQMATREYVSHPGAAAVIAVDEKGCVILVRQCRYPIGKITYELPAGKLERRDSALGCARRELREETGFSAGRIRKLLSFWPAPAFSNETLHIFMADRLRRGKIALDEDEFLEVVTIPFQKALDWVSSGKIKDSKTIIGLQAYALRKSKTKPL